MQETEQMWVRSLDQEDPLEEYMVTHSITLAWRIPWTEEPDGLQSIGLQSQTRLKLLSMHAWMNICQSQFPNSSHHSSLGNQKFDLYICDFTFKWYYMIFSNILIFLFLTSPVWQSLSPSTSLEMTLFYFFLWLTFHCVYVYIYTTSLFIPLSKVIWEVPCAGYWK